MITLDITGFYYRFQVPKTDNIKTVLNLMEEAQDRNLAGETSEGGGRLTFELEPPKNEFVRKITVVFGPGSTPTSRQKNLINIPLRRPSGVYTYEDDVTSKSNRIEFDNPRNVSGLLTWQYYITDVDGKLVSGAGPNGERTIVPMSKSDRRELGGRPLQDGDTVAWRLVGIFGINEFFDQNMNLLLAKANGQPLGLKAAFEILKAEKVDLSSVLE